MLIKASEIPEIEDAIGHFSFPKAFGKVVSLNLVDYDLWYLMGKNHILQRRTGLLSRYPNRNLVPFARRDDCDDIACFDIEHGEKVFIVHDFAASGWEHRKAYPDFWCWFKDAVQDMIHRDDETE